MAGVLGIFMVLSIIGIAESAKTALVIYILFFSLCVSVLLITRGDLFALAGFYTISFLGVMTLFVVGNILLKFVAPSEKFPFGLEELGGVMIII